MGTELVFINDASKREYVVVSRDREHGTIKLRGEWSTFEQPYNPTRFKELGYRLVEREKKKEETSDDAEWIRLALGTDKISALDRLRQVPLLMPRNSFYEDIYLVAIEEPYGSNQAGTQAKLNRVLGAVLACVPQEVQVWTVMPGDWRKALGLAGNASKEEAALAVCALRQAALARWNVEHWPHREWEVWPQDACDAYAVARCARDRNNRAVEETLAARSLELF